MDKLTDLTVKNDAALPIATEWRSNKSIQRNETNIWNHYESKRNLVNKDVI